MNIPNILTLLRIVMIPIFVVVYYWPVMGAHYLAALIFGIAAFTDYLDGWLARLLNQQSPLGEFLDPVADKLIVVTSIVLLVAEPYLHYLAIPAAVIIGREVLMASLRQWMAERQLQANVAVSFLGKCKTALQLVAISALILYRPQGPAMVFWGGYICFYIAAALSLWSLIVYIRAALKVL